MRGLPSLSARNPSSRRQGARRRVARVLGPAAVAGLCGLAGPATPAQAATVDIYAAPSPAGTGDCSSPADACSIVDAVADANATSATDSVRVRLADGNYPLSSPTPTALDITFAGPSLTLEAQSGTPTLDGTSTVRLLSVGATSNVTVVGVDIESGATTGLGGAIQNLGTLTVRDSTFSNNSAGNGGAIASALGATLTVVDSTLTGNTATGVGGGGILAGGATTVIRSAIVDNTVPVNGGGINVQPAGVATLSHSTIAGNTSGGLGGALSNLGTITVQASTIADNTASDGASIATGNSNVTFAATIIAAQSSGAACNPANASITDGGYNLDADGTCLSPDAPATGSHNGTVAYGSSTYGAALDAYLADALADNGGPTQTFALLNSPNPPTALDNPAFDIVPASFALPVAVDGVTAACSSPDQRGVVPVAGADCAIGAYLLQATSTALVTPAAVAGQSVTLTATVRPAPEGGTVAFDDGPGNPATTLCAERSLSSGTATCTVTYPASGDYAVIAHYSGDGPSNGFTPSTSTPQTVRVTPPVDPVPVVTPGPEPVVTPPDRTAPTTTIRRVTSVKPPITLRGTATDAGSVQRVRVSVARQVRNRRCRFLQADRTFSKARNCAKTSYLDATGTSVWSLKLPSLPHGRYMIWVRSIDAAGNVELKNRGRNLIVLRIPAQRKATAKG